MQLVCKVFFFAGLGRFVRAGFRVEYISGRASARIRLADAQGDCYDDSDGSEIASPQS